MEFLGVEINESTSLNTSIAIQPTDPEPEVVMNDNISPAQPEPETQDTTVQNNQNLLHPLSQCEGASAVKSNFSSINNILPCPDSDHNRSKREEIVPKTGEKSHFANTLPPSSSLNPDLVAMRQKIGFETLKTTSDRLPARTSARPPLNPGEVAKGLTALHSKVDEILRKKSQPRGRDSSFDSERPQRAASSDTRSETKTAQPLILLNSSYYKEAATPEILSGRTCHSIDVGGFSGLSGLLAQAEDCRDVIAHLKNLKAQTNITQDLSLKEKSVSNPVKTSSSPKSKFHVTARLPSYTPAIKPNIAVEALKYNSAHLSQKLTEESFHSQENNKPKAKYDEKKLDAILSRIRERNSVSPGPGSRGSVQESEARNGQRYSIASQANSLNATRRLQELSNLQKEIKQDERNTSMYSNWRLNTLPKEDKSIDDIPTEKDFNVTGNTTILELFDKKRSVSSPKFRDVNAEEDKRSSFRLNKAVAPVNESQLYERKQVHTVSDKSYYDTSSLGSSGKYNVQDLIKELKNRKPTGYNTEQRTAAETVRVADQFLERTRNIIGLNGTLKAGDLSIQLGTYKNGYTPQPVQDSTQKRGREMPSDVSATQNEPSNYYCGGLENDKDSLWETVGNKEGAEQKDNRSDMEVKDIHTTGVSQGHYIGSSRRREQEAHPEKKLSDNKVEKVNYINRINQENALHFNKNDLIAKLNIEKERQQGKFDKGGRNLLEDQSPIKRVEDDSLMMDESVFSIRDGALTGEMNTNRLFNNTESQDRLSKRPKVCNRTELCNTEIRKKYMQDDQDLSDFDFDRNKLEPTERDLNENTGRFKLRFDKLEMNQESKSTAKKQKVEEKRPSSMGYSSEKKVPKTEMPRRGIIGRGAY